MGVSSSTASVSPPTSAPTSDVSNVSTINVSTEQHMDTAAEPVPRAVQSYADVLKNMFEKDPNILFSKPSGYKNVNYSVPR